MLINEAVHVRLECLYSRISTMSRSISPREFLQTPVVANLNLKVAWTRGSAAARRPITGAVEGVSAGWSAEDGTEGSSPRINASLASSGVGFRRLPTKLGRSDGILHLFHKELIFGNRGTGPRVFEDCVSRNQAVYDTDPLCDFRLEHRELKQLSRRTGLLTSSVFGILRFTTTAVFSFGLTC